MKFKNLKKIYQRKIVIKAVRENLKLNFKKYEIEIKKINCFFLLWESQVTLILLLPIKRNTVLIEYEL